MPSPTLSSNLWFSTVGNRGRTPCRIVQATRDIACFCSPDVYAGQLCFVANPQRHGLHDRIHAVRYQGKTMVARVQIMVGRIRLSWGESGRDGYIDAEGDQLENLGPVVGLCAQDRNPLLWMYGN